MELKTLTCSSCKSHDFKLINDSIAKCNYCGAYVVYRENDDPEATHYYAVKKDKDAESFLKSALLELSENDETPYDLFSKSEFGATSFLYQQICHITGDVDVTYNAQIGVDRKEEYTEYNSSSNKYEKKTRTVTDWTPISGTYNYSGSSDCIINGDTPELIFVDGVVFDNAYSFDGELDFEIDEPTQISNEELNLCEGDLRSDARYSAERQASRSGDHIRNFNSSCRSTITSINRIVVPAYINNYTYNNENYRIHSFAVKNARNRISYPNVSKDIENEVKKKMNFSFTRPLLVNVFVMAVIPIILGVIIKNENATTLIAFAAIIIGIIYYFVYKKIMSDKIREIKENNKVIKRKELSELLETLSLGDIKIEDNTNETKKYKEEKLENNEENKITPEQINQSHAFVLSPSNATKVLDENSNDLKRVCPNCGAPVDDDYIFCISCGARLPEVAVDDENDVNIDIIDKLLKSGYKNDVAFTYWIYEIENIVIADEKYVKLHLFNRKWDSSKLKSITIQDKKGETERSVILEKGYSKNVYSCSFNVEDDFSLVKMNLDNSCEKSSGKMTLVENDERNVLDAIKTIYKDVKYHPIINNDYWMCICGRINMPNCRKCVCGKTDDEIMDICTADYGTVYINKFLSEFNDFNLDISFEENINQLFNKFKNTYPDIELKKLKDQMDMFEYLEKYNSLKG